MTKKEERLTRALTLIERAESLYVNREPVSVIRYMAMVAQAALLPERRKKAA